MPEIIDLSQEIYSGMPVFNDLPEVSITVHSSHEEWEGIENPSTLSPSVCRLSFSEHTGTHVDSISHMDRPFVSQSIDTMPLSMFYTQGICLDFSYKKLRELITIQDLEQACAKANLQINKGDTVLLCTDHYRKHFGTDFWNAGPGLSADAATWLGEKAIAAFGVETMCPGIPKVSNRAVHQICGAMGFTHYENMVNLYQLLDRGHFRFIALPLKIRGGTGSPVRAVAVFE